MGGALGLATRHRIASGPQRDPVRGRVSVNSWDVERRLTTILSADVVGYSRLMAADETGTLARLKAQR